MLIGAVEPFYHLLVWAEFLGYCIVVCETCDLGNVEPEFIAVFTEELPGGKRIRAVGISDKEEIFGKLLKVLEDHPHSHDAGTDPAVVRYLVTDDCTRCGIHDKSDEPLNAADFYINFIGHVSRPLFIWVCIDKRLHAKSGRLAVVGDHLMGNKDSVHVLQSLSGLSQRQSEIDLVGEAEGHDLRIILRKFEE